MIRPQCFALAFASFSAASLLSLAARADDAPVAEAAAAPEPVAVPAPPAPTQWYGWQTLMADGAAVTLFALSTQRSLGWDGLEHPSPLLYASGATWALGAPAVHLAHGNVRKAALSAALRTAAPTVVFLGAGLGSLALLDRGHSGEGSWGAALAAVAIGTASAMGTMVTASVLDAAVLAREPAPDQTQQKDARAKEPPQRAFALTPMADPKNGTAGLSASGSF